MSTSFLNRQTNCNTSYGPPPVQRIADMYRNDPHVVSESQGDAIGSSKVVFVDYSTNPSCEVEIDAPCRDDTQCCNCSKRFPRKKKPSTGLVRYSLKCSNVDNALLSAKGNFVCSSCHSYFTTKKGGAAQAKAEKKSTNKPERRDSLFDIMCNEGACFEGQCPIEVDRCSQPSQLLDHTYCSVPAGLISTPVKRIPSGVRSVPRSHRHRTPQNDVHCRFQSSKASELHLKMRWSN